MANSYFYSNTALQTTLSGSISAGATSMTVGATTGFPLSVPYVLAVDFGAATEELVKVTVVAGATLTVERGFSGTSAQSHSLGAVVRHVYHAGDATDFRTHEAAASGVHGITGTLVGTSDTQTLTNKTLTSPTINSGTLAGGALSGTFTGTPTLSGAVVLGGDPVFQGGTATTEATRARVSGDAASRLSVRADGRLSWGDGTSAVDTVLYRTEAGVLATDGTFRVLGAGGTDDAISIRQTGDTNSRLLIEADGSLYWGTGSDLVDTRLYRSAADTLKTDDNFVIKTHRAHWGESGTHSFTFSSQTSATTSVSFATAFAAAPRVTCNINNTAGSTLQWTAKAGGISTTGFTLIVSGPSATWSSVEVQWVAFAQ